MTERTLETRLGWLAGIIDGEGWIGFGIRTRTYVPKGKWRRRQPGHYQYATWNVGVSNTNPAILCEVASIADHLAARYTYQLHTKQRGNRKEQQRIDFAAKADVKIVLEAVLPYLVGKRAQAELLLRAMHHRYGKQETALLYRNAGGLPVRLDEEFREMVASLRQLNQRGIAPKGD